MVVCGGDGENRTPNMAPTVADALRDVSGALSHLADILDQTDHKNKRNQKTDQ